MTLKTTMYPAVVGDHKTLLAKPFDPTKDTLIHVRDLSVFPAAPNRVVIQKATKEHLITYLYTSKSAPVGEGTLTIGDPAKYTEIDLPGAATTLYPVTSYVWRPYCQADDQAQRENITDHQTRLETHDKTLKDHETRIKTAEAEITEIKKHLTIHIKTADELEKHLLTGANMILDTDLQIPHTLSVPASTTSSLDLNGRRITPENPGYRFLNVFGTLTMYDTLGTGTISGFQTAANDPDGGALCCDSCTLTLNGLTFDNNSSSRSGGTLFTTRGTANIINCTIQNTTSQTYGGAIYNRLGTLLIDRTTIQNTASPKGGAIVNTYRSTTTVSNSRIDTSTAQTHGGAIYNTGTDLGTPDSDPASLPSSSPNPEKNTATTLYATLIQNTTVTAPNAQGGAIYTESATITLTGCTLTNCRAPTGDGGAIYSENNELNTPNKLIDTVIQNTTAQNGGAIAASGSNGSFDLTTTRIQNCTAANQGSALYLTAACTATLLDTVIENCPTPATDLTTAAVHITKDTRLTLSGSTRITDNPRNVYLEPTDGKPNFTLTNPLTDIVSIWDPNPDHRIASPWIIGETTPTAAGAENIHRDQYLYYAAYINPDDKNLYWTYKPLTYDELDTILQTSQPDPIKLLTDLTSTHEIYIPPTTTNTLDLNEHTIKSTAETPHRFMAIDKPKSITIQNGELYGFKTEESGGAFYITGDRTKITLDKLTIHDCTAKSGGALFVLGAWYLSLTLTSTTIRNCHAHEKGGAINFYGGDLNLSDCDIQTNTANTDAAGIYSYGRHVTLTGKTLIANNQTINQGKSGGIVVYPFRPLLLCKLYISGEVSIKQNKNGASDNSDVFVYEKTTLEFPKENTGTIFIDYAGDLPKASQPFALIGDSVKTTCGCAPEPYITTLEPAVSSNTLIWKEKPKKEEVDYRDIPLNPFHPLNPLKPLDGPVILRKGVDLLKKNLENPPTPHSHPAEQTEKETLKNDN